MKKKIFSLVMGIFLLFGGLFAFSGCSLVSKDTNKINNNIVMKIGNTNVTKNDLYNAFYTYYQNKLNPQPINGFIDLKERDKNDKTILGHIITYFSKDGTHMKQAEVEGSLRVGTNSSIEKNPYISLGSFRLQVEQNGSLSIIAM